MYKVDLNSDIGESFGAYKMGDDVEILEAVTSANVACGFHAGDPLVMQKTLAACAWKGVAAGAHPGYPDLVGFGRRNMKCTPDEEYADCLYQIGALKAFCRANGLVLQHVKPHGAMYNAIVHHEAQAKAVIDGIKTFGDIPVMLLPGGVAVDVAEARGLTVIREAFADRNYNPDGTLVSRTQDNAVLHSADDVVKRVLEVAETGAITAIDGSVLSVDAQSVCTHGDSPGAVEMLRGVVAELNARGIEIRSFI